VQYWTAIQKPEITGKHSKKRKKTRSTKTKRIVNTDIQFKLGRGRVFTFSLAGGRFAPLPPVSYATDQLHFKHEQPQLLLIEPHVTIDMIQWTQDAANVLWAYRHNSWQAWPTVILRFMETRWKARRYHHESWIKLNFVIDK